MTSPVLASSHSAPTRVQRQRSPGWRKPAEAVVVDRSTRWGNPWRVNDWQPLIGDETAAFVVACFGGFLDRRLHALWLGVDPYRFEPPDLYPTIAEIRAELAGRDLCCWCPPHRSCHADVLLAVANRTLP